MFEAEVLIGFVVACIVLDLAPGPDNLFVLAQSINSGFKAGFVVVLGLCTGLFLHSIAVVMGISALVQSSMLAFTILKFGGALYLLFLAWKAFQSSSQRLNDDDQKTIKLAVLYRRGILMSVSNPKLLVFFMAFLPQFTDSSKGDVSSQLMILAGIFIGLALLVFSLISLLADYLGRRLGDSPRFMQWLNRTTGVIFAGLAIKLVLVAR